ncbi:MAG TPA: phosphatidate cytidylyltransferase [Usitatibacter sp.]|jgi:phosphatidate cytidylyltransferase|nr:phosphatidate cytidylyltransferase [Usitatibacter sp.]
MLRTRVITALVLLPVVLGALFLAPAPAWALFALAIALLGCWEWSRMSNLGVAAQSAYLVASGALGAALWVLSIRGERVFPSIAYGGLVLAALFWLFVATVWLTRHLRPPPVVCAIAGWLVLWPTWLALVLLRQASPWLLLALAALVWVADICAYFAGKAFGRHKLAPRISPGKTWEGVAGGVAGVVVYGLVLAFAARDSSLGPVFARGAGVPALAAMIALTAFSVVGDLFESWMKRGAGLKDSSSLLPGHGGVLDRIDALTSTLPLAALALMVMR